MKAVGITDIGLQRKRNEDAYLIDLQRNLFVVCDGMGGHKGGDVASRMAVNIIDQECKYTDVNEIASTLRTSIELANQQIRQAGLENDEVREMGTTVTAAIIDQDQMIVAHVGDSSLFIVKEQEIVKLTNDHTLAEQMLKDGLIKQEEIRGNAFNHVLTRALGTDRHVHIDIIQEKIESGDWVMLCTDGLSNLVEMKEIMTLLNKQHEPQEAARELIDLALSRGGHDNITVILIKI